MTLLDVRRFRVSNVTINIKDNIKERRFKGAEEAKSFDVKKRLWRSKCNLLGILPSIRDKWFDIVPWLLNITNFGSGDDTFFLLL
jgi:hypothetical protein